MDKYINEDRAEIASVFGAVKEKIDNAVENAGKIEDFINTLCSCAKDLEILRFKLQHMEDCGGIDGVNSMKPDTTVGVSIMRNKFMELSKELQESIADTSWVEDIDTFKESQKNMLKQLNDIINSVDCTQDQKDEAKNILDAMENKTPKQDTPEWLVRKMKADMTVMGLQSALVSTIVDALRV